MSLKYHIVCGHSAAGSFKLMIKDFKLNNEHEQNIIIDLQDDLSMGSLSGIDVNPTTKNRFSSMYKYFDKILCEYDLFSEILENDIKLLPSLNIINGECIIWHGYNAPEKLILQRVAWWLAKRDILCSERS